MVIGSIKTEDVAGFLRLDKDDPKTLWPIMDAAKEYILGYTGMSEDELDDHEDLYIAFMVLCQDMYDNRVMYVDKNNVNRVVESILFRHRRNFV